MSARAFHYRYLLLFLAFVPFGRWVLSGQAADDRAAEIAGLSASAGAPLLAADSHMQWVFAAASAIVYLLAAIWLLEGRGIRIRPLVAATCFTATVGLTLLLAVQRIAEQSSHEDWSGGRNWMILHYLLNGIAYSYRATSQVEGSFWIQLVGYIFGVGLCEETTKLLPVLYLMRKNRSTEESDARVLGFMSGIGFGVAEGVVYSVQQYNGSAAASMYVIRFVSVVAMHAFATAASAGLLISCGFQHEIQGEIEGSSAWKLLLRFVVIILPVMVLHAIYDVFCVRGMFDAALCSELILIAIFAYQMDRKLPAASFQSAR